MTATTGAVQERPSRTIPRWAGAVAIGGAIATASLLASFDGGSDPAPAAVSPTAVEPVVLGIHRMSADAAEHWLSDDPVDVANMSADAAEHWLSDDPVDVTDMSADAAERWLGD